MVLSSPILRFFYEKTISFCASVSVTAAGCILYARHRKLCDLESLCRFKCVLLLLKLFAQQTQKGISFFFSIKTNSLSHFSLKCLFLLFRFEILNSIPSGSESESEEHNISFCINTVVVTEFVTFSIDFDVDAIAAESLRFDLIQI